MPGYCSKHFACMTIHYSSPQSYEVHIFISPVKKFRHRAVNKYIDGSYTASEQRSQDLKPSSITHS